MNKLDFLALKIMTISEPYTDDEKIKKKRLAYHSNIIRTIFDYMQIQY